MTEPVKRGPVDEVKAKFKEALDRKKAHTKDGEAHRDGSPKIHGVHGAVSGKREFRRKSG